MKRKQFLLATLSVLGMLVACSAPGTSSGQTSNNDSSGQGGIITGPSTTRGGSGYVRPDDSISRPSYSFSTLPSTSAQTSSSTPADVHTHVVDFVPGTPSTKAAPDGVKPHYVCRVCKAEFSDPAAKYELGANEKAMQANEKNNNFFDATFWSGLSSGRDGDDTSRGNPGATPTEDTDCITFTNSARGQLFYSWASNNGQHAFDSSGKTPAESREQPMNYEFEFTTTDEFNMGVSNSTNGTYKGGNVIHFGKQSTEFNCGIAGTLVDASSPVHIVADGKTHNFVNLYIRRNADRSLSYAVYINGVHCQFVDDQNPLPNGYTAVDADGNCEVVKTGLGQRLVIDPMKENVINHHDPVMDDATGLQKVDDAGNPVFNDYTTYEYVEGATVKFYSFMYFKTATMGDHYHGAPADHVCTHYCPICGLCTDKNCTDPACQPKCPGHTGGTSSSSQAPSQSSAPASSASQGQATSSQQGNPQYTELLIGEGNNPWVNRMGHVVSGVPDLTLNGVDSTTLSATGKGVPDTARVRETVKGHENATPWKYKGAQGAQARCMTKATVEANKTYSIKYTWINNGTTTAKFSIWQINTNSEKSCTTAGNEYPEVKASLVLAPGAEQTVTMNFTFVKANTNLMFLFEIDETVDAVQDVYVCAQIATL